MLTYEAPDGHAYPLLHPYEAARNLRRELTLEASYPPLPLARALENHLQGRYRLEFAKIPRPDFWLENDCLTIQLPQKPLSDAELANTVVRGAGFVVLMDLLQGPDPETDLFVTWVQQFARKFLEP